MSRRGNYRGGGGSRYSALKSFSNVEDPQRHKDQSKRRVTFKTSQLAPKTNVKLRLEDVRRLNEDDDMMMTMQDRPVSKLRRRDSPIPRAKYVQLVSNKLGWYQVTIRNGRLFEKETLLHSLQEAISPLVIIPQYWRSEESRVIFFTDNFQVAERIQQLGSLAKLPDGVPLSPLVSCGFPPVTINEELKAKMKMVMAKRYNIETKALDLSRFHADPDLQPIFCPLFLLSVMCVALDIICENIPDVEAINLNDNELHTIEAFKGVEKRLPHLKILYLGDNKIPTLINLFIFCRLRLVELVLRNNPCSLRYKNPVQFVRQLRRKFPALIKLDGEALMPQESVVLPTTKASFMCNIDGAEVLRQFLEQYFNIFDSGNRQPLLDAYHDHALLSMSMPSMTQAGRLDSFWKFNRNLRRTRNIERGEGYMRLLKIGRLACVSTLDEWPRTLHERCSFTVDLTMCNPQMMVFTVTGLFKELTGATDALQSYELRYFVRTFVVVPQNAGFCIRNETIFITSATVEQTHEFERSQTTNPSLNSLQCQSAAVATNVNISSLSDETKMQMVQNLSTQSQMNLDWSHKCLEETNWDFNQAIYVFEKLFKENKIPPEAFIK
ncbi:nuclear RNA export factor 1-like [Drosophila innubila]|uniref:nuclear RNA export factor 1-like n=1 Tax=Drosophila innubila TaxID=198719 RepID=UPI00148D4A65|nr:nuclear RNA export factor 1-like [Drosophila innubila]